MVLAESSSIVSLLLAIPALLIAIGGFVNARISKREVQGKSEQVWMTLAKESTDMVLERMEELKKENRECKEEMRNLKRWLIQQGIKVPDPPTFPGMG